MPQARVIVLAVPSARAWRSASRGAWDAERLNIYFLGAFRRPRGSLEPRLRRCRRQRLEGRPVLPAPGSLRNVRRSLVQGLRDLSAVGSPHRTLALPEVSAQTRSDASGLLPIRFQPFRRPRRSTGRSDQTGVVPIRGAPPNQLSVLPSPVDAFHRPQALAPPHVTTPHERAPRVDGTAGVIGQGSAIVKDYFQTPTTSS